MSRATADRRPPTTDRYMPACTVLGDAFVDLRVDDRDTGAQITDIVLRSNPAFHFGLNATGPEVQAFNRAQVGLTADVLDALTVLPGPDEPILPHTINSLSSDQ